MVFAAKRSSWSGEGLDELEEECKEKYNEEELRYSIKSVCVRHGKFKAQMEFVAHTSLGTVRKRKAVSANRRKRAPGERRRKKKQKLCHYDNEKPSRACSHTTHSYCDTHYHNWAPPLDRVLSFVLGGVEEKRKSKKNITKALSCTLRVQKIAKPIRMAAVESRCHTAQIPRIPLRWVK